MIKLRSAVEHITFQNPENGWSVMKVNFMVKEYNNLVTLNKSLLNVPVGSVALHDEDWKVDAHYGLQFLIQVSAKNMPILKQTTKSILKICSMSNTKQISAFPLITEKTWGIHSEHTVRNNDLFLHCNLK